MMRDSHQLDQGMSHLLSLSRLCFLQWIPQIILDIDAVDLINCCSEKVEKAMIFFCRYSLRLQRRRKCG